MRRSLCSAIVASLFHCTLPVRTVGTKGRCKKVCREFYQIKIHIIWLGWGWDDVQWKWKRQKYENGMKKWDTLSFPFFSIILKPLLHLCGVSQSQLLWSKMKIDLDLSAMGLKGWHTWITIYFYDRFSTVRLFNHSILYVEVRSYNSCNNYNLKFTNQFQNGTRRERS